MPINVAGFAWYRPENYLRLLEIFEDAEKLPRTFEDWLAKAEAGCKNFEDRGIWVIRVNIDPDEFLTWCGANNLKIDAKARMKFANIEAYRVAKAGQGSSSAH